MFLASIISCIMHTVNFQWFTRCKDKLGYVFYDFNNNIVEIYGLRDTIHNAICEIR